MSIEEIKMCNPQVSFASQMRRKATLMLKSLDYNPDEIDVRAVVSAFIENVGPERFESVLLGIIDPNSPVFIEFLNDWEDYHYPSHFPNPPQSLF